MQINEIILQKFQVQLEDKRNLHRRHLLNKQLQENGRIKPVINRRLSSLVGVSPTCIHPKLQKINSKLLLQTVKHTLKTLLGSFILGSTASRNNFHVVSKFSLINFKKLAGFILQTFFCHSLFSHLSAEARN